MPIVNDLASISTYTSTANEQLLAGDQEIKTDSATALAALTRYTIGALTATGVAVFVAGTHTAAQAVLVMQDAANGAKVQFAYQGIFNDDLLASIAGNATLYANAAMDTYLERRAFFNGLFRVGKVGPGWAAI